MKGTKRFAVSESSPTVNDSVFRNKRITVGSAFDIHRAENSQQESMTTPPLNMQHAESSRQHVRALNNQFASWVQTQLKNHPDELWEDGIKDYLAHASNIMEKFTDVVNWLKANASKGESLPAAEAQVADKKLMPEAKSNELKLFQGQTGLSPVSTTTSFPTSWSTGAFSNNQNTKAVLTNSQSSGVYSSSQSSGMFSNSQSPGAFSSSGPSFGIFSTTQSSGLSSDNQSSGVFSNSQSALLFPSNQTSGLFSNNQSSGLSFNSQSPGFFSANQTPILFGNKTSTTANCEASDDVDGENEEQPSSPSVKKSEEKGVTVVHEVKCKLYVKSSDPADKDPWKDRGTGKLSIKCNEGVGKGTKESKPTIIVRNDVGRILLNALLYPGIKTNLQKNSIATIFHTAGDGDDNKAIARTFLIRLKTEDDRNKLATAIQDYAPSS